VGQPKEIAMTQPAQFTVVCPACSSELTLTTRRLLVRVDAGTATSGEVLFSCLGCRAASTVTLSVSDVVALLFAGVSYLSISEPVVDHPESPPDGPPLTCDDLLDLHAALALDGWFERLRGVGA
jgi:hypothetical protein